MAGRHIARTGGLRRIGDVIVDHPFPTGAVVTAALVAALAVTPLGMADRTPAPAHAYTPAPGAAPVVGLSVPNVVGLTESRASDALRAQGFSMEFRTESGESATGRTDDVVIRQSPGAGTRVAKGTRIALTVAPAGSGVATPPQDAAGSVGPGTVSTPAGSDVTTASGGATGGSGGAVSVGGGGAAPAQAAPAPAPQPPAVEAPAPQPPAAPPAPSVTPPPALTVPTPPVPLPKLPLAPLGVVGGLLRGLN